MLNPNNFSNFQIEVFFLLSQSIKLTEDIRIGMACDDDDKIIPSFWEYDFMIGDVGILVTVSKVIFFKQHSTSTSDLKVIKFLLNGGIK